MAVAPLSLHTEYPHLGTPPPAGAPEPVEYMSQADKDHRARNARGKRPMEGSRFTPRQQQRATERELRDKTESGRTAPLNRPSQYLRARCPLCFGGTFKKGRRGTEPCVLNSLNLLSEY